MGRLPKVFAAAVLTVVAGMWGLSALHVSPRRLEVEKRARRTPPTHSKSHHKPESECVFPTLAPAPPEFAEAVEKYPKLLAVHLSERIEQSSSVFHDFKEKKSDGVLLPTPSGGGVAKPACNGDDFEFTEDEACVEYMADLLNWKRLKPMYAVLSDARTIKFKALFRNNQRAIIKVPQKKFLLEPYSELMAYKVDRLLGLRRVPPTAWVPLPVSWLKAAMADQMPPMYSQWVESFVFNNSKVAKAIKTWCGAPEPLLWVSVQLWMGDVHTAPRTALTVPPSMSPILSMEAPVEEGGMAKWVLGEYTDMYAFDFIIGNQDRRPGKNVFAVGKCGEKGWECGDGVADKARPRLVFVDQGSAFYSLEDPPGSVFHVSKKKRMPANHCRFRRRIYKAVQRYGGGEKLKKTLDHVMPLTGYWSYFGKRQYLGAQLRIDKLKKYMASCVDRYPESDVFALE